MADQRRDYNHWTKESLIRRIKTLEDELRRRDAAASSSGAAHDAPLAPPDASEPIAEPLEPSEEPPEKRQKKCMDPSKYSTRFIALKLAYLGKNYNGLEYQASGRNTTIEEELWKALVKAFLIFPEHPDQVDWDCCEFSKCGRTDRGVSAFGQVVALRVRSNKPPRTRKPVPEATEVDASTAGDGTSQAQLEETAVDEDRDDSDAPFPLEKEIPYCRVLNRLLPPDIKAYAWCPSPPPGFSARFSCVERQYRYFFTQPAFAPMPRSLEIRRPGQMQSGWLDVGAMRKAAKLFEGLHDFRNFCKADPAKQITNFKRRVFEADIVEVKDVDSSIPFLSSPHLRDPNVPEGATYPQVYYFHVRGSAFLWHQIRHMAAILFLVGQGLEPPTVITDLLDPEKHPRKPNYVLASDLPLVLWDCKFAHARQDGAERDPRGDPDALEWVPVGRENPLSLQGSSGLTADLWQYWRAKKMDEILANRLLDWAAAQTGAAAEPPPGQKPVTSVRVFEGGDGPKYAGKYKPVLERPLLASPEEMNDRWAQSKGFENAESMRAVGNWRERVREEKERKRNGGDGMSVDE